jgi:putative chitinase
MATVDWATVQRRLGKLYPGKVDNVPGPMTWIAIVDYATPAIDNGLDAVTLRGRQLARSFREFELTTAGRIAGFLSNTTHETGDYRRLRENLYYTTAARIRAVWPSRFPTLAHAAPFVRNPIALANKVYGARMGNRGSATMDGWNYRGGGDIQTTGLDNYQAAGEDLDLPLVERPELIETPAVSLLTGLSYWRRHRLNRFYDAGTPKRGRALINTGSPDREPIGWDDVEKRHDRLEELLA